MNSKVEGQTFSRFKRTVFAIATAIAFASPLFATSGFADSTEDLLIGKLKLVLSKMPASDKSRTPIAMRLADLYAERARVQSMHELEKGCTQCDAGISDRKEALKLYNEVLANLPAVQQGKVLSQIGHLYQMLGESQKAEASYLKAINTPEVSQSAVAEAHLSIAEMAFKVRDFKKATLNYQKVLAIPESNSKGLAAYRLAWSHFNQGQLETAISGLIQILKTPELSSRSAQAGTTQVDVQFQEEVSRDLATFVSKKTVVSIQDAELLNEVSPSTSRLSNLAYLAAETERIGNLKAAVELWTYSAGRQVEASAQLESQVHIASLEFDIVASQKSSSAEDAFGRSSQALQKALLLFNEVASQPAQASADQSLASSDLLKELKARLRKLVLDWNRREKSSPSDLLLENYKAFLQTFPQDAEMWMLSGQALHDRKIYSESVSAFAKAADLECSAKNSKGCEAALLAGIGAAELHADKAVLQTARERYLSLSIDRTRELDVRYQLAHEHYEAAEYEKAVGAFSAIARDQTLTSAESVKVRLQAADLSLDALALLKADDRLESTAIEWAKLFPERAADFSQIARTSVLNQALKLASDQGQLRTAWLALERFDRKNASNEELAKYWKNRLILAEKLKLIGPAREAAAQMLKNPLVSGVDREFALGREAWLAEMVLDFKSALEATRSMKASADLTEETRLLKMSLYAELANEKEQLAQIERELLKVTQDPERKVALATRIVMKSQDLVAEAVKQYQILKTSPAALAQVALEVFAQSFDSSGGQLSGASKRGKAGSATQKAASDFVDLALRDEAVRTSAEGRSILRRRFIDAAEPVIVKATTLNLNATSDSKLAQSLKARIQALKELEGKADSAIQSGDWLNQTYVLSALGRESSRLYQDLMAAPLPKGLNEQEEQEYLQLLASQAAPFQTRATEVADKLKSFWAQAASVESLTRDLAMSSPRVRKLLSFEIGKIAQVADDAALKAQYEGLLSPEAAEAASANQQASAAGSTVAEELVAQRVAVAQNPFDPAKITQLLSSVEAAQNSPVFASYLKTRLSQLKEESK